MAQRLSCDERVWIEAMRAAGVSVEVTARRLGRHRSCTASSTATAGTADTSGGEAQDAQARRRSRLGGGGRAASRGGRRRSRGLPERCLPRTSHAKAQPAV